MYLIIISRENVIFLQQYTINPTNIDGNRVGGARKYFQLPKGSRLKKFGNHWVTVTAWNSKVEGVKLGSLKREKLHLGESRRPVPPPLPVGLGVWVKEYAVERAAGVMCWME